MYAVYYKWKMGVEAGMEEFEDKDDNDWHLKIFGS